MYRVCNKRVRVPGLCVSCGRVLPLAVFLPNNTLVGDNVNTDTPCLGAISKIWHRIVTSRKEEDETVGATKREQC